VRSDAHFNAPTSLTQPYPSSSPPHLTCNNDQQHLLFDQVHGRRRQGDLRDEIVSQCTSPYRSRKLPCYCKHDVMFRAVLWSICTDDDRFAAGTVLVSRCMEMTGGRRRSRQGCTSDGSGRAVCIYVISGSILIAFLERCHSTMTSAMPEEGSPTTISDSRWIFVQRYS
jgi:hypothetical protein